MRSVGEGSDVRIYEENLIWDKRDGVIVEQWCEKSKNLASAKKKKIYIYIQY